MNECEGVRQRKNAEEVIAQAPRAQALSYITDGRKACRVSRRMPRFGKGAHLLHQRGRLLTRLGEGAGSWVVGRVHIYLGCGDIKVCLQTDKKEERSRRRRQSSISPDVLKNSIGLLLELFPEVIDCPSAFSQLSTFLPFFLPLAIACMFSTFSLATPLFPENFPFTVTHQLHCSSHTTQSWQVKGNPSNSNFGNEAFYRFA